MQKLDKFIKESFEQINEKNLHWLRPKAPIGLSNIDRELAKDIVSKEHNGYLKETTYKKVKIALKDLKPSQKELQISKALRICFDDYLVNGVPNKLGLIVSNDGYIVDGHHRWCAGVLTSPNKEVEVYQVDLPINQLISALNVLCVGKHDTQGQNGRGNVENLNKKFVSRMIEHGKLGVALKKIGVDKLNELSHKLDLDSLDNICCVPYEQAIKRIDMPVIDDDKIEDLLDTLVSGKVDFGDIK